MNPTPLRLPSPVPLLETALALAVQLFLARHPALLLPDEMPRVRQAPSLRAARAIVALLDALLAELACYDAIVAHSDAQLTVHRHRGPEHVAPAPDDDIPF